MNECLAMGNTSLKPMNLTEAAHELGLAPSTVRERILAGDLEAEKDGGRWIIYPNAVKQYRERRRYRPNGKEYKPPADPPPKVTKLTEEERAILQESGIRWC